MRTPSPLAALTLTACLAACSSEDCRPNNDLIDRPSSSLDCAPGELCYLGGCRTSCNAGETCNTDSDCPAVRPRCAQGPGAKLCTNCDPGEYCVAAQHICVQLNYSPPEDPTDPGSGALQPDGTEPTPTTPGTTLSPGKGTPKGPDPYPDPIVAPTNIGQIELQIADKQALVQQIAFPASAVGESQWFIDAERKLFTQTTERFAHSNTCVTVTRNPVTATAVLLGSTPVCTYFPNSMAPGTVVTADTEVSPSTAKVINSVQLTATSPNGGAWTVQRDLPGQPTIGETSVTAGQVVIPWAVTAPLPGHVLQLEVEQGTTRIVCQRSLSDRVGSGTFILPTSALVNNTAYTYRLHALREGRVKTAPALHLRLRVRVSTKDQTFQTLP